MSSSMSRYYKTSINVLVDFGLDRVNLFGSGVLLDTTFYTFDKGQKNVEGVYFDITNGLQEKFKILFKKKSFLLRNKFCNFAT